MYQSDGSGDLARGVFASGEVFETYAPTTTPGVYSGAGSRVNAACGPLVIGWSYGNWIYPRGLWTGDDAVKHADDPGVEVAETSIEDRTRLNVFDGSLDWLAPWR